LYKIVHIRFNVTKNDKRRTNIRYQLDGIKYEQ